MPCPRLKLSSNTSNSKILTRAAKVPEVRPSLSFLSAPRLPAPDTHQLAASSSLGRDHLPQALQPPPHPSLLSFNAAEKKTFFFPLKSPPGGLRVAPYQNILFLSTRQKPVIVFICLLISRPSPRTQSRSGAVGSCVHVAQNGTCGFLSRGSPPSSPPPHPPAAPGISGGISPEAGMMNHKAPDPTIPHGGRWLCLDSNTPFLGAALTSLHFSSSPGDVCRPGSDIYHCVRLCMRSPPPARPTPPRGRVTQYPLPRGTHPEPHPRAPPTRGPHERPFICVRPAPPSSR